ncbi:MAG: trypsin-like peptidase domain-containing protein [Kofleriaceae bacterium]
MKAVLILTLVFGWVGSVRAEPTPQQKIAMTAKPSVVRVWGAYVATLSVAGQKLQVGVGGSGTGFFISPDGYIATNAHVVSDIHAGEDAIKDRLYMQLIRELQVRGGRDIAGMSVVEIRRALEGSAMVELEKRAYVVLPNGDKLPYEITAFGKPASGRDVAIVKVKTQNAPALAIGDSTKTLVADQIVVIGYPGVADMKVLLDEKSLLQASVTDGSISSLKHATSGEPILQISAPITHGNSGGPALDMRGTVVGLATFGNESEIQGFNFLVGSATLKELIEEAKIEIKPSETMKLWQEGLAHYWADEYTAAVEKFQEVDTLFPAHSDVTSLIRQSNQAKKDGKEKQPASSGGMIAGIVLGGLVVVGGAGFALTRRTAGPAPGSANQPPMPMPMPMPMIGNAPPHAGGQPYGPPHQPHQPHPPHHPMPMAGPAHPHAPGAGGAQQPMFGRVQQQSAAQPQMFGRLPNAPQEIPKTVAVQSAGIAPTAFISQSLGNLTCTRGQLMGQRFSLMPSGLIVGRQPNVAHILVNDHRASGKHAWIGIENGKLVVIDQGTTNGTYVNDVSRGRITRHELRDGDVIIIGEPDCLSLQIKLGA